MKIKGTKAKVVILALATMVIMVAAAAGLLTLENHSSSFDFGAQDVGTTSAAQTLTFSNSGSGALTISGVGMTGANSGSFTILGNTCTGATLGAGGTCTASVRFAPKSAGDLSARLRLNDDASGSPHMVPLNGTGIDPAAPKRHVGPIDMRDGFPLWYEDEVGLRLGLCLDANGLCLSPLPNPNQPPSVTDAFINFPEETFWWFAGADITRAIGGKAQLILALEAAFTTAGPTVGEQIAFGRVRIRIDKLRPRMSYKVTHPYGVNTVVADSFGAVRFTEDLGPLTSPADFSLALRSRIGPFLRWNPAVAPAPPAGYIGDPAVPHQVVGSSFGTNFFRVDGPDAGGLGD